MGGAPEESTPDVEETCTCEDGAATRKRAGRVRRADVDSEPEPASPSGADRISDAVAKAHTMLVAGAPGFSQAMLHITAAHTASMNMHQSASRTQNQQILEQAATVRAINELYDNGAMVEALMVDLLDRMMKSEGGASSKSTSNASSCSTGCGGRGLCNPDNPCPDCR